jgi:hypothetical protein
MCDEMLVCTKTDFLDELAPFSPDDQWIESACNLLTDKKLLGTPAQTARPVNPDAPGSRRSTRIAAQVRTDAEEAAEVVGTKPEAETEVCVQWSPKHLVKANNDDRAQIRLAGRRFVTMIPGIW